jgi:hypothetical protein
MGTKRLGQLVLQALLFLGQQTHARTLMKHNKDLSKTLCCTAAKAIDLFQLVKTSG